MNQKYWSLDCDILQGPEDAAVTVGKAIHHTEAKRLVDELNKVGSSDLLAAIDVRIIELEFRIEAITSTINSLADPTDFALQRGIELHVLDLLKIRRHEIAANV